MPHQQLAATGPGAISLDAALGLALAEPVRLALAVLALLGGLTALAIARLAPPTRAVARDR